MKTGHDVPFDTYRTDHLKHRLLKHFGDRLVFFRSSKRVTDPELVMTESVTKRVLFEHTTETIHGEKKDVVDDDMEELDLHEGFASDGNLQMFEMALQLLNSVIYLWRLVFKQLNTIHHVPTKHFLPHFSAMISSGFVTLFELRKKTSLSPKCFSNLCLRWPL